MNAAFARSVHLLQFRVAAFSCQLSATGHYISVSSATRDYTAILQFGPDRLNMETEQSAFLDLVLQDRRWSEGMS